MFCCLLLTNDLFSKCFLYHSLHSIASKFLRLHIMCFHIFKEFLYTIIGVISFIENILELADTSA